MEPGQISLDDAVQDLSAVRRLLERGDLRNESSTSRTSLAMQVFLQAGALGAALPLLVTELQSGIQTRALLLSAVHPVARYAGLAGMGAIIGALLISAYLLVWCAARRQGETLQRFLQRNIAYLSTLSFSSDRFVKFVVIAVVLEAGQPEWVAPLLFLFTGDYLLQGRLFTFPVTASVTLGVLCMVAGIIQAIVGNPAVSYPLLMFVALAVCSGARTLQRIRTAEG